MTHPGSSRDKRAQLGPVGLASGHVDVTTETTATTRLMAAPVSSVGVCTVFATTLSLSMLISWLTTGDDLLIDWVVRVEESVS